MCSGMLSDPEAGGGRVVIKSGLLIASQLYGSRKARAIAQRFRYEARPGRFQLIGEDISDLDRLTGDFTDAGTKISDRQTGCREGGTRYSDPYSSDTTHRSAISSGIASMNRDGLERTMPLSRS